MARLAQDVDLSSGILRGKTGSMAKVSWTDVPRFTTVAGLGSSTAAGRSESQDGGPGFWSLSAGGTAPGNGAGLGFSTSATAVGVRVRRGTASTQGALDLIVDGRCVEAFNITQSKNNGIIAATWQDNEASFEYPYPLNYMPHTVIARVDSDPAGAVTNQVPIAGFLLPRSDGYRDVAPAPRRGSINAYVQVPTTAGGFSGVDATAAAVGIRFQNTDTAASHVVTIKTDTGAIYAIVTVPQATSASVPGTLYFSFGSPKYLTSWTWGVDAGTTTSGALENV